MLARLICKFFGHAGPNKVFRLAPHAQEDDPLRPIEWDCPRCGAKAKALQLGYLRGTHAAKGPSGFRTGTGSQTASPKAPLAIGEE